MPCFLKILASWGDFFDNGLLPHPVSDHTMQCCTRKPFIVAKPEPQSCSASAFPYFAAKAEIGVISKQSFQFRHLWKTVWQGVLLLLGWGVSPGKIYSGTSPAVLLAPSKTEDTSSPSSPLAWHALTLRERWHLIRVELLYARLKYKPATLWLLNVEKIFSAPPPYHLPIKVFWTNLLPTHRNSSPFTLLQAYFWLYPSL